MTKGTNFIHDNWLNLKIIGLKSHLHQLSVYIGLTSLSPQLWFTRHSADWVRPSVQESLDNFGLDYLDLYYIHWPTSWKVSYDAVLTK